MRDASRRRGRPWMTVALAIFIAFGVLAVCSRGASPLPPLGPALDPGTGAWTAAADAELPARGAIHVPGLRGHATVTFDGDGTAHIQASDDRDVFLLTGYLHARFRLFQMDLERRQAEGRLSEIAGAQALGIDNFQLRIGLLRTAQAEWRATTGAARDALTAYAEGVNDRIAEDRADHTLPFLFHILAYSPTSWTPVDTLAVQGDITETLGLTSTPIDYAVLTQTLGFARTKAWFPVQPADQQYPYDTTSLRRSPLVPLPSQQSVDGMTLASLEHIQAHLEALGVLHTSGNSNNWAVSGAHTASGKPLMAGDPHLHQTLPAIWYQLSQDSPHYHVSGVSIPGTPVVLIGRNRHISWSLTNTQNQSTFFYREKTDRSHPHQYFWHGSWHHMGKLIYSVPVRGGKGETLTVWTTAHGPIMSDDRLPRATIAQYWTGALPSDDMSALLGIDRASTFRQFRDALRTWNAPTQNFIYADDRGNIGLISPGYYPQVRRGAPWLPLPGTGESDVIGSIPFNAIPQAYNPSSGVLFTANQRPVGRDYPYYVGTSWDFFDNGYRADRIHQVLAGKRGLTIADMERLQTDTHDYLALRLRPAILKALRTGHLHGVDAIAAGIFEQWDGRMDVHSPGAAIWWTFWSRYLHDTFDPWWKLAKVPFQTFESLRVGPSQAPLDEDLETWTLHDPSNPAFSPVGQHHRVAASVMLQAFHEAVRSLHHRFGAPQSWTWGALHTRQFDSLAEINGLGYGPRPAGSDLWTVNAASGEFQSDSGPSWRMIVDWGAGRAEGMYPGGQSENPASPWYKNRIDDWWNGRYRPLRDVAGGRPKGGVTWTVLA